MGRAAHDTLNLKIGNAFDVVAERKQIDLQKMAGSTYEVEFDVTLLNHKAVPVTVEVDEPLGGTWRMRAWATSLQAPIVNSTGGMAMVAAHRDSATAACRPARSD